MICDIEFRVKPGPVQKILTGNPVRKTSFSMGSSERKRLYFG